MEAIGHPMIYRWLTRKRCTPDGVSTERSVNSHRRSDHRELHSNCSAYLIASMKQWLLCV